MSDFPKSVIALPLALVALVVVYVFVGRRAPAAPEIAIQLPDFELVERDGSTVGLADLAGQPWIADFIFTRCAVYCPRLTARMKELREQLPEGVRTVSFSVDPEHDTPAILSEYARTWGIEGRDWLFLTGERPAMWRLIREGFLQPVEETPEVVASPILHSNRFILVDARGRMRSFYDAFEEATASNLVRDLSALQHEDETP